MDGGEGLHVIRCAGGTQDPTIMNRIMLRFRPIAPKPVNGGSDSGFSQMGNKNMLGSKGRTKRKYVRVCKKNRYCKRNKKISSPDRQEMEKQKEDSSFNDVVTLQLLPERSDLKEEPERDESWCNLHLTMAAKENQEASVSCKLKQPVIPGIDGQDRDQTVVMNPLKKKEVVESWVTVECVTDIYSCMDGRGLGCTDVERVRSLEEDTCPGFISDGCNNVKWVNGAFKRMMDVKEEKDGLPLEIIVRLVIKEKFLEYVCCSAAFTCWVRLQYYTWQKEKWSQMVPCDVWRMDCGGFAWRLDVEAALSLGR